ncbi:hypothetical protein SUGI_0697970 [Cryptomeria japonica]|nr:hypothetical protein SUGI_0697970 [Cryptomeria japonica]
MELVWNLKQNNSHIHNFKSTERMKVKWTPPLPRWKKLKFDGASRGNLGQARYGMVVRDKEGCLVGAICGPVGMASNNTA